jgi:hypothetical protein
LAALAYCRFEYTLWISGTLLLNETRLLGKLASPSCSDAGPELTLVALVPLPDGGELGLGKPRRLLRNGCDLARSRKLNIDAAELSHSLVSVLAIVCQLVSGTQQLTSGVPNVRSSCILRPVAHMCDDAGMKGDLALMRLSL